jgi:hypothetical protein
VIFQGFTSSPTINIPLSPPFSSSPLRLPTSLRPVDSRDRVDQVDRRQTLGDLLACGLVGLWAWACSMMKAVSVSNILRLDGFTAVGP